MWPNPFLSQAQTNLAELSYFKLQEAKPVRSKLVVFDLLFNCMLLACYILVF